MLTEMLNGEKCVVPPLCVTTRGSLSKHCSFPACNYHQEVDVIAFFPLSWQFKLIEDQRNTQSDYLL